MDKQLMETVLPSLTKRLHTQLRRYRSGEIDDAGFTESFESVLHKQYADLAEQGVPEKKAAIAIHGAVLVLSGTGLRLEAEHRGVPFEVIEFQAMKTAAEDLAEYYELDCMRTMKQLAQIVAKYAE